MPLLNINRKSATWLVAEFVIVVLGVATALAADSWRETLQEIEIERDYLQRLIDDLDDGYEEIQSNMVRIESAGESAERLLAFIRGNHDYQNETDLIKELIFASRTGGRGYAWSHDVTYNELLSTGRLNLIRSSSLRNTISNYYRQTSFLLETRAEFPVFIADRLSQITATPIRSLIVDEEIEIDEHLFSVILAELDDENIARELGSTASSSKSLSQFATSVLENNRQLRALILGELET